MIKKFIIIISFLSLYSCSLNSNSSYWDNKNEDDIFVKNDKNDTNKNNFDEIKSNIIEYGKKSEFPNIED